MDAKCFSIETDTNFTQELKDTDTVAFCYPIYGSRIPRNMREFVARYKSDINGKKIIILVTQALFSGDGARVFTDLFLDSKIDVIYAEHINMPNNVNNMVILRKATDIRLKKYVRKADVKLLRVCNDIKTGIIKKRGFSRFSQVLGCIQGKIWQGDSRKVEPDIRSAEYKLKKSVKIRKECTACNLCVGLCPVRNLLNKDGKIVTNNNCIVCYRCINHCPAKAISIMINTKPGWLYKGINNVL